MRNIPTRDFPSEVNVGYQSAYGLALGLLENEKSFLAARSFDDAVARPLQRGCYQLSDEFFVLNDEDNERRNGLI